MTVIVLFVNCGWGDYDVAYPLCHGLSPRSPLTSTGSGSAQMTLPTMPGSSPRNVTLLAGRYCVSFSSTNQDHTFDSLVTFLASGPSRSSQTVCIGWWQRIVTASPALKPPARAVHVRE